VIAEQTTELFILHRHDFDKILIKFPAAGGEVQKALKDRER
jgi:hypothetical protein